MTGSVLRHRPEPVYKAPTQAEYNMGIDGWVWKKCRFCGKSIQRRGLFRRWSHVE